MVKIKNQSFDPTKETYTDAGGTVHYSGEAFRRVMSLPAPLDAPGDWEKVNPNAKNKRPSSQGPGSLAQAPYRECFKNCASAWNALPAICDDLPECVYKATKESAYYWAVERGVVSGYFDGWMSCCMGLCGPDGSLLGAPEDCFPCVNPLGPLAPSEDNPETIVCPGSAVLSVGGGVPPYSWVRTFGDCMYPASTTGASITVGFNDCSCCSGEWEVSDACGDKIRIGLRGTVGGWVAIDPTVCFTYGPQTSPGVRVHGIYRCEEHLFNIYTWSWSGRDAGRCNSDLAAAIAYAGTLCTMYPYCDGVMGCSPHLNCIEEMRVPLIQVAYACVPWGLGYYAEFRAWCFSYRLNSRWECI